MPDHAVIQHLARRCAGANLRMAQAVDLFTVLYLADAVMLASGNLTSAADKAGIHLATMDRRTKQATAAAYDADEEGIE